MRRLLLTAVVALTGGSAMASSIEYVNGTHTSNGSFVRLDCAGCQPVKDKAAPEGFTIPSIEPGTQHTEMREIEGKRTLVRTEAWLGGAPVTFVSTNPAWMPQETPGTAIATYDEGEAGTPPGNGSHARRHRHDGDHGSDEDNFGGQCHGTVKRISNSDTRFPGFQIARQLTDSVGAVFDDKSQIIASSLHFSKFTATIR